MKKVFVGIPAYDGKVITSVVDMLMEMKKYVEVELFFVDGCSLISAARNEIFTEFVERSAAEYMLMLDADNFLDRMGVHKLCKHVRLGTDHCVSGKIPYRLLTPRQEGPWGKVDEDGFVDMVGAACLLVPRAVAQSVAARCETYTGFCYVRRKNEDFYEAFTIGRIPNPNQEQGGFVLQGEDVSFVAHIHAAGSRILLDDEMVGFHVGSCQFDFRTQALVKKAYLDAEKQGLPR